MKVCLIYSGQLRTWNQCKQNHADCLTPEPAHVVHYNEMTPFKHEPYTVDEWGYDANKAGETQAWNTMNMWRVMYEAFQMAPLGMDVYVRIRYDIVLEGSVDFRQYDYPADKVYIPVGSDYREGINDQFAFGSYEAMSKYYGVYLEHPLHFAAGKMFHSESYLKHSLDLHGIRIERLPFANRIIRP